jgi:hypothetical protein
MIMIMHHIALCIPCIALFNCGHLLHIRVDHVETKSKFQAEQIQWMFGDPQASSSDDANIFVIKASPGTSHQSSLAFLSIFIIMSCWILYLSL